MKKKELTKQQRHEIYKLAKKYIEDDTAEFICQALYYAIHELHKNLRLSKAYINALAYINTLDLCPEIQKKKPKSVTDPESAWWSYDSLGYRSSKNVRIWMLDTAIEQTKEIKPEMVSNPIKTFNDIKIETYELALEYLKKDYVPYSMCIALESAITHIFHAKNRDIEIIYKKYFAKEFAKNKPKGISVDSFWFKDDDMQTRVDYFNNIINELKNGTNKKENK